MVLSSLVVIAIFGVLLWVRHTNHSAALDGWRRFAQDRGLSFSVSRWLRVPVISGQIDGISVVVTATRLSHERSNNIFTMVKVSIGAALPTGFEVARQHLGFGFIKMLGGQDIPVDDERLDDELVIMGEDEVAIADMMADTRLVAAFSSLLGARARLRVRDGSVLCQRRGEDADAMEELFDASVAVARELARAWRAPWVDCAAQRSLRFREDGELFELTGRVQGLELQVRHGDGTTIIEVPLPERLQLGLSAQRGSSGGVRTGDLVLDGALSIAGPDEVAVRALIAAGGDELRGSLLEVLHGHPGSSLDGDRVRLMVAGDPRGGLGALMDQAVGLARALDAAAARTSSADVEPG